MSMQCVRCGKADYEHVTRVKFTGNVAFQVCDDCYNFAIKQFDQTDLAKERSNLIAEMALRQVSVLGRIVSPDDITAVREINEKVLENERQCRELWTKFLSPLEAKVEA